MLDTQVILLTLENVGLLLLFIAIGFVLRASGKLPEDSGKVLSLLTTMVFTPAYTIRSLAANFTVESIGQKAVLFVSGVAVVLIVMVAAWVLAKLLGRTPFEKKSMMYAFSIPNYGYFGYPVVEGVFGAAVKADMIVFCIPTSLVTNTVGYLLFAKDKKISWKKVLLSPMILGVLIGMVIGLSGLKLPSFLDKALQSAGNCMSPASMLLAGFVLGAYPLKELLSNWRSYMISLVRLVALPAVFGIVMVLLGIREMNLLIPLVLLSMPLGLNLVVFPESHGYDAGDNAKWCFVSYLMAMLILPFTFALIQYLSQLPV